MEHSLQIFKIEDKMINNASQPPDAQQFLEDCDSMHRAALTLSSEFDSYMSQEGRADLKTQARKLLMEIDDWNLEPDQIPDNLAEAIKFLSN